MSKTKELEETLAKFVKTCDQLDNLLKNERAQRLKLAKEKEAHEQILVKARADSENQNQIVTRLKGQVAVLEREKVANEKHIKVLEATLMERDTELAILKLKMTRLTVPLNSVSSTVSDKQDPCKNFTASGRSKSEFTRNSYGRSTMIAEALTIRSSTSKQQPDEGNAAIWNQVPQHLTPNKRPLFLDTHSRQIYKNEAVGLTINSSSPTTRDRRYRTMPRSMKSPVQDLAESQKPEPSSKGNIPEPATSPKSNLTKAIPIKSSTEVATDKPFAEWDTEMLNDWLNCIGLSMYSNQCRKWVRCGAHIMNATPAEVDKGLGITNHLHRKKLRLAISELNGDCDKITKAAAKLDYLWVARWLDDIGLPQYKEAFINARLDGRVLNYLTVEDLISLGVKGVLHHSSIKCGIRVLRSINFDMQLLKRRATAEEVEIMNLKLQKMNQSPGDGPYETKNEPSNTGETDVSLWTCHRVMEWLRMIDLAEYAPNLRGSGVHGGLIIFEDGFTIDTIRSLLSIPSNRTLIRRHLTTHFENLIGANLLQEKNQYLAQSSNQQLDPLDKVKTPKKSMWLGKLKSSKVAQDVTDEYLCPMYPVEPQLIKNPAKRKNNELKASALPRIPESINV